MKKIIVFIESNTSGSGMLAIDKALEMNIEPIFLTRNPALYPELSTKKITTILCDTHSLEKLKEVITLTIKDNHSWGITTTSEFYINTVAELNFYFQKPANHPSTTQLVRDKGAMRDFFHEEPYLYHPAYLIVNNIPHVLANEKDIPYPCVVKPLDDSGSNLVRKCNTISEVLAQTKQILAQKSNSRGQAKSERVLIEEFIEGPEYSVEILSFKGQNLIVGFTLKTVSNPPYFVESGHLFPAPLKPNEYVMLKETVNNILSSVSWKYGPAHLEFKIKNKKMCLIEFNGRLAGGMIPEIIQLATAVDLLKEQIKIACDIPPISTIQPSQTAEIKHLVPAKTGKIHFANVSEVPCTWGEYKLKIAQGDSVQKAQNAYDRIGYIIAVGENAQITSHKLNCIEEALKITIMEDQS